MADKRLIYLPLGGAGEIGMNLYIYGYGRPGRERFIAVDAGVAFPHMETAPGVDLVMPDLTWLKERAQQVEGIFLTHAHEDHLGAIGHLCRHVRTRVFARPFTAAIARLKLDEAGVPPDVICHADPSLNSIDAGPFQVRFVPVPHSIPEASALAIESPAGRIVHTGDFMAAADPDAWSAWNDLAAGETAALVCDSTNIFVRRNGRPEDSIGPALSDLIANSQGLVAATTFASNVARVHHIAQAGHAAGRSVVLLGRAMNRMVGAARESKVMTGFPPFLAPESALGEPRARLLLLTTGSQGEPRSATSQLSFGKFRGFKLLAGDTVLISSRTIPGNELSVARVVNRFAAAGVKVVEDHDGLYHVSGHANRPDLTELQRRLSPRLVVPMHGEVRHLVEHSELARGNGFRSSTALNGQMLDLQSGEIIEQISPVGRDYLDGTVMVPGSSFVIRDRLRLARDGAVAVAVSFGRRRRQFEIAAKCSGLAASPCCDSPESAVTAAVEDRLRSPDLRAETNDEIIEREISLAVRRAVVSEFGKRPVVSVLLTGG